MDNSPAPQHPGPPPDASPHVPHGGLPAVALAALGIVFGDIGTSPLYTLSLCVHGEHGAGTTIPGVLGVLSLIFWSLTMVVTVKYLLFIMRADNHGEGGILALLALLPARREREDHNVSTLTLLVLVGAALLYGDGVITPAISVLSAVEGLGVATTDLQPYVVPLTCVILFALFVIQRHGTAGIGRLFGPVMVLWFVTIGVLGAIQVARAPGVLAALSPQYAAEYLTTNGLRGPAILGAVVLAVTGGEALYADMGHFGARPIRLAWLALVFPALVLSYFGQGALILSGGDVGNPFFAQVPQGPLTFALVGLSTAATVIASQALISGVFSLTQQATQLGMFPRVAVRHTSEHAEGQIYLPEINWALAIACVALVLGFRSSDKLAAAYGIAVSGTMGITSICYYQVARQTWGWPVAKAAPVLALFLMFDVPFFAANLIKFVDGGYVPIGIAAVVCALMLIWNRGRRLLAERNQELSMPEDKFIDGLDQRLLARLPETTVFLAGPTEGIPRPMNQYASHLRVLGEKVVVVTVHSEHVPVVSEADRVEIVPLDAAHGVYRVVGHVGFMEELDVPALLSAAAKTGLPIDLDHVSYVVARETLLATSAGKMGAVTESIYSFMLRNSPSASDYFCLPPDQVIELGTRVDL
jgi:KUP system potassium uptake protein